MNDWLDAVMVLVMGLFAMALLIGGMPYVDVEPQTIQPIRDIVSGLTLVGVVGLICRSHR